MIMNQPADLSNSHLAVPDLTEMEMDDFQQ